MKITLNGFHGYESHNVRGTMNPEIDEFQTEGYIIEITPSAAAKFGCKMSDCTCGEGIAESFWVRKTQVRGNEIEVAGNYPQR